VYVATADAPSILVIGRDGERRTIGREDFQSIALNGEILQAYKDSVIDSSPAGRRPGVRRSLGNHQFPEFLPPYRDVRLDRQGLIWIAHFGIPGRQINEWDVFNPSGEWVASVEMPDQFHPTEIGADYLLGVRFDSMDVERVQVFSLQR
jgi:hypothetical protein